MFRVILITFCWCSCAHIVQTGVIEYPRENDVQIIGVNSESQMKILEELDLYSLTLTTNSNKELSQLADGVFKKKFATKAIGIFGPLSMDPRYSVHILDKIITNYNFEVFSLILRTFGHLIDKLVIGYDGITLDQRKDIHHLIFEYCSKSLTSVELIEWDENVLESFKIQLPNVNHLTLSGNLKSKSNGVLSIFNDNALALSEIFPGLRELTLDTLWVTDPSILNVRFPQLKHVKITLLPPPFNHPLDHYFAKSKPAMKKLFENNPQIKSLTINNCNSLAYVQIAAENLPDLEEFEVNFGRLEEKYTGEQFHFENLKKLVMKIGNIDMAPIMTLKNVEEIRLECIDQECNHLPFNTVSNLKKLFIVGYTFNTEKILSLAEKIPFLEKLFIASESDVDASAVIRLIVGSKRLEKLTLVNPFGQSLFDTITRHLTAEWKIMRNNLVYTIEKQSDL